MGTNILFKKLLLKFVLNILIPIKRYKKEMQQDVVEYIII